MHIPVAGFTSEQQQFFYISSDILARYIRVAAYSVLPSNEVDFVTLLK